MDILSLLEEKKIHYERKGEHEVAIHCPNAHNHAGGVDSRPSFSINIDKLKAHCFACGYKLGEKGLYRWLIGGEADELLMQAIGIRAAVRRIEADSAADGELLRLDTEEFGLLPPGKLWVEDYRGIPATLYQELRCRHCTQGYFRDRIILPIFIEGKIRGFESRDLTGEAIPKYLRNKGFDSLHLGLYPYDYVKAMRPKFVILCEGVFDALNAVSKGFPALCIFGTRSWSMAKLSLILALGVSEVVFCLDNDAAGNGAEMILIELSRGWVDMSVADKSAMVGGKDLGDLSRREIENCIAKRRRVK